MEIKGNLPPIELIQSEPEYAERLTRCINNCSYFVEQFMGDKDFKIYDYNKAFLDCEDRFIVYRTGRQVGKSTNVALKAIHFGFFAPLKAKNLGEGVANVVIASLSKDQASLIFEKIINFVHKSPTLTRQVIRETRTELHMKWFDNSGYTKFIVRPIGDTGEGLRGFTSHFVILDEAAYIPEAVYVSFMPSAFTTKAKIVITSTPKGKAGFFFKACQESFILYEKGIPSPILDYDDNPRDSDKHIWSQFHVTSYDNPETATDTKLLNMVRGMTADTVKREIMGEFVDGGNALIPFDLLQEALRKPEKRPRFEYYDLGVDTSGKGADETVLTTYGISPEGIAYAVHVYTEATTDQTQLALKINELDNVYRYRTIFVDSTGIGDTLIDICNRVNSTLPIYPINFKQDKVNLYVNLSRLFVERSINFSLLDEIDRDKLVDQISYMYWEHGTYKDQAPKVRTEHPDDYSDSTALGVFGLQNTEYIQDVPLSFWG